jgi:creatinine amidohydrolase
VSVLELAASPWTLVRDLRERGERLVAFLPIGAVEAHGPHLPLATDSIIAHEIALAAGMALSGGVACLLPAIPYAPAEYARAYAGTISIRPETLRALVVDIARSLEGFAGLVLVNGHLEPDHIRNLRVIAEEARTAGTLGFVLAPEWTSKRYRSLLPEEFFAGGAHAGAYETSLVMAGEPELVDEEIRAGLVARRTDLAAAMKSGARRFNDIPGGEAGYFGDPASATAKEGQRIRDALAAEVAREIQEALG